MSDTRPFRTDPHDPAFTAPARIDSDTTYFRRITEALAHGLAEAERRLTDLRASRVSAGQAALARDSEIRHVGARHRMLQRHRAELCLGRMVSTRGEITWIGRIGLGDENGERLLLDWRSPAAKPFFAATAADTQGLASRRRYRWSRGEVVGYWDELLDEASSDPATLRLDADSLALLETSRAGGRMGEVLSTLHRDQDAAIRASSRGPLLVSGGPGTGKTVVALHRAAYLMSQDPSVGERQGGVLVLGPHRPWLHHVSDVLPSLGEEGVVVATLADLVPGTDARAEEDPAADLKDTTRVREWIDTAVRVYEEPPTSSHDVETPWGALSVTAPMWARAFAAAPAELSHNAARDLVWEALLDQVEEQFRDRYEAEQWDSDAWDETAPPVPAQQIRAAVGRDREVAEAFSRGWTLLEPDDVVADLWSVPAYLRHAAPDLTRAEVDRLQRTDPYAFTVVDTPFLDAARMRVGDPEIVRERHRERSRAQAASRAMTATIEHALNADLDGDHQVQMLRGQDLREGLVDPLAAPARDQDRLMGPFAHVVVDEAQELGDAQWQMVLARCPSGSLTLVGDRTQSRAAFDESWGERLERIGVPPVHEHHLGLNYRTPAAVMEYAGAKVLADLPDADVPRSIRPGGVPVRHGAVAELAAVVHAFRDAHPEGTVGVITVQPEPRSPVAPGVWWLTPSNAKGLEFDLVVVLEPMAFGHGRAGAVDRYVAQTRAAAELVVLG